MVCAIANKMLGKRSAEGGAEKLLIGLILTLSILQPLQQFDMDDISDIVDELDWQAQEAVDRGETHSRNERNLLIKQRTEEYILQRASELQVSIQVEVVLSDEQVPAPEKVYLSGDFSPFAKMQLQTILERDLGIAKENQIWN